MSNETQPDKKPPADNLTRVKVRHMYFIDPADLPGGINSTSNIKCYPDPPEQSRYFTASWIPAWQQFEVTFHPGPAAAPITEYMGPRNVKKWVKG